MQRSRQREIVEIMTRGLRQRSRLSPSGHSAVNQPRIAREHDLGAKAKTFHCARPETFNQRIGLCDEFARKRNSFGTFEIDGDRWARAVQQFKFCRHVDAKVARGNPVDADDLGAEIGEQHGRHRAGTDAGKLDNTNARERPHLALTFCVFVRFKQRNALH
jgi:hypothetical protein